MNKRLLWLSKHQYEIELPLFGLMMVTLILWRTGMVREDFLITIALSLMGIYYYLSGRFKPEVNEPYGIIATRIVSLSSMISVIGILLTMLRSGLGRDVAFLGSFCLMLTILINLFFLIRSKDGNYVPFILRAIVFAVLAGAAFMQGI